MKNDLVSITELVKMRGVTTETLRHYDRIDLLKPAYIDPESNTRYYSLSCESEKLGTILELKQLNMSLKEIKDFVHGRNQEESLWMLKTKQAELKTKIQKMQKLDLVLDRRIRTMEIALSGDFDFEHVTIKSLSERHVLVSKAPCHSAFDLNLNAISLGSKLEEIPPDLEHHSFFLIYSQESVNLGINVRTPCKIGIFVDPEKVNGDWVTVKAGTFACVYSYGLYWDIDTVVSRVADFCQREGYQIAGDIIELVTVDMSLTDDVEENVYEIQIPVIQK